MAGRRGSAPHGEDEAGKERGSHRGDPGVSDPHAGLPYPLSVQALPDLAFPLQRAQTLVAFERNPTAQPWHPPPTHAPAKRGYDGYVNSATATGATALVVDFLNTLDVETRSDLLDRPAAWSTWAGGRGLMAGDPDLARSVRGALRNVLSGVPAELPAVPLTVSAAGGDLRLVPTAIHDATSTVLAAFATVAAQEGLSRFKLCAADDCRWAFHDHSKNHSRTWCDMAVCGNRAKSRKYRARGPGESAGSTP